MFRGLNTIALDNKGRLAMPTRYRQPLQDSCAGRLVMTIDTDQSCLLLYPTPTWLEIEKKLAALPSFDARARRVQRLLIGHATEIELDSAGRMLIPPPLREFAELEKEVALVGQGNKFELWSDAQWQACRESWLSQQKNQAGELSEALRGLSL